MENVSRLTSAVCLPELLPFVCCKEGTRGSRSGNPGNELPPRCNNHLLELALRRFVPGEIVCPLRDLGHVGGLLLFFVRESQESGN